MASIRFTLTDVGEGLSEAEVQAWLVSVGDAVRRDQSVVEIETDKSLVELPAPADGIITEIFAAVGDIVPVGGPLFLLETIDELDQNEMSATPAAPPQSSARPDAPPPLGNDNGPAAPPRILAAPATRKLALELGVALDQLEGSGPGGRISRDDVSRAGSLGGTSKGEGKAALPAGNKGSRSTRAGTTEPLRGLRRQTANAMTESWTTIPHITEIREVDATELQQAHQVLRAATEGEIDSLTLMPLFIKAVTCALRRHPEVNASLDLDRQIIEYKAECNVGIAAATPEGLMVPVLRDADTMSLQTIARELQELTSLARARKLAPGQMSGGTFTVTNFGSFGSWIGTPIIRPPEVAIAGFGRISDTVVAVNGLPVVRPTLPLSVSADHRLLDGEDLARFVTSLANFLSHPITLLLEVAG